MISKDNLGKKVEIEGRVSEIPWQHMINTVTGKDAFYIDLEDGDQIVAYIEGEINHTGLLRMEGTVIETAGRSKRPGSDERFVEYQLDVFNWECIGDDNNKQHVSIDDLNSLENG